MMVLTDWLIRVQVGWPGPVLLDPLRHGLTGASPSTATLPGSADIAATAADTNRSGHPGANAASAILIAPHPYSARDWT
ncbi:hypothetical protein LSTR_LSTR009517 [Laodelphax striatellus]|uniref:Uncharacterized protein n=1 Tax=Laodelphax striatellus TaxID=195883 RepID=A0A482XNX4_LAOST|nr:hypothetical protein LSTR_LSTR009517 [Laodelphax striatellus]